MYLSPTVVESMIANVDDQPVGNCHKTEQHPDADGQQTALAAANDCPKC
jgi:hypothetical protein